MGTRFTQVVVVAAVVCLFSCKDSPSKNHGPIVLGDSSTIVTENDPAQLQDMVTDLKPVLTSSVKKDTTDEDNHTAATPKADTPKKTAVAVAPPKPAAAQPVTGNGLRADFTETTVLITNVNGKIAGKADLHRANGAVYTMTSGTLNGSLIKVSGNITKVSQRYQTMVVVKNELGTLPVESLASTTNWQPLKGTGNTYRIAGLESKSLDEPDGNRNTIRNAVGKAAKRHHMSRKKVQEWENSVRNARETNQKPLYVTLRSVMWKIDGKDDKGRMFSKQIRIDIPM